MLKFRSRKKTYIPKITIIIWLLTLLAIILTQFTTVQLNSHFAIIPSVLMSNFQNDTGYFFKIFSALFLHATWQHWLGNMILFLIIALPLEKQLGSFWFVLIYFVSGFAANITSIYQLSDSTHYLLGASGAVSGILGAWLMLFPTQKVSIIIPIGLYLQKAKIPIILLAAIWLSFQIILQFLSSNNYSIVWSAHIVGFIVGFFMAWLYRLST